MQGRIDTSFQTLQRDLFASGLAARIGMSSFGVWLAVEAKLLRVLARGSGKRATRYVARERLDVRLGDRVLCTIVLDYVPATLRSTLSGIDEELAKGKALPALAVRCEILPGEGFKYDVKSGLLVAEIPARDVPPPDEAEEVLKGPFSERVRALQQLSGGRK